MAYLVRSSSHISSSLPFLPLAAPRWGPTAPTPSCVPLPPRRRWRVRLRSRFTTSASLNPNILRVIQTTWKVAKSGVEAGANLVPDSIPRPIARIGVTGVGIIVALFLLKSFLSTLFFTVAMMALIYFTFVALNTDEAPQPRGGDTYSTDEDALEEARRIMDKYK